MVALLAADSVGSGSCVVLEAIPQHADLGEKSSWPGEDRWRYLGARWVRPIAEAESLERRTRTASLDAHFLADHSRYADGRRTNIRDGRFHMVTGLEALDGCSPLLSGYEMC